MNTVFDGKPYAVICADYEFGPGAQDIQLLSRCAAVAAMAHAPFIANTSPEFFGEESFNRLPHIRDLKSLFEGPQYIRWQAFRKSEDSRYVGLCLPRFLLRLPYTEISAPIKAFNFNEDSFQHSHYCGDASHALVTRIAESFAKYRWCLHIVGPNAGGLVQHDIVDEYAAMKEFRKIATEISVTSHKEFELSEEGFIPWLFMHRPMAHVLSANSVQKPKKFGNSVKGKRLETDYRLSTNLYFSYKSLGSFN
jgi:type VI secretion system protein ImpC